MSKKRAYMAIDVQTGTHYDIGFNHPRKWLLNHFCRKSARVMWRDKADGTARKAGYIIAGMWLELFVVSPAWK